MTVRYARRFDRTTDLCRDYELITNAALLHPLAKELLRCLVLTVIHMSARHVNDNGRDRLVIGRIDEVAAQIKVRVQELEAGCLIHRSHEGVPLVANAHSAELDGRNAHARTRGQDAIDAKFGGRLWSRCEEGHDDGSSRRAIATPDHLEGLL